MWGPILPPSPTSCGTLSNNLTSLCFSFLIYKLGAIITTIIITIIIITTTNYNTNNIIILI